MQAVRWVVCVSALTALLLMSNHPTTAAVRVMRLGFGRVHYESVERI